jgi:serine/threonine-protein kinase
MQKTKNKTVSREIHVVLLSVRTKAGYAISESIGIRQKSQRPRESGVAARRTRTVSQLHRKPRSGRVIIARERIRTSIMLETGTRLGPYQILSPIGAGGMGEVYRARDANLKRDVAVKVLPAVLAHDNERMARFRREAEVLASLNHPGIATIYGLEGDAIVMEMVEGETLAGPLPLDTALRYAKQIVEALEYAHDRGVIHRDLKPANIKITPEGGVKLLDFGLAKAIENPSAANDPANSPTLTLGYTQAGVVLGTAGYMSPEQAVGKMVDRRSDIFSFGAVLYELLTGKPAFTGESAGEILAAVVKVDPDWSSLPAETPEWLRRLLRRCLVKDRKQRLQAIGEARIALENPEQPSAITARPVSRLRSGGWIAAGLMAAAAGVSLWLALQPKPAQPRVVTHFTIPLPQGSFRVPNGIAFSADGSRLAFVAGPQRQIFVRDMDQLEARPIPGTAGARYLCFSPDGQWISYVAERRLNRVAVAGGPVQFLAEAGELMGPPTQRWETDGSILFADQGVLKRVPDGGGTVETIATPDTKQGERAFFAPQLLPGGKKALISSIGRSPKLMALDLATGAKSLLLEGLEAAQFAPSGSADSTVGHLIYFDIRTQSLMAVAFDAGRLQVQGSPVPIIEKLQAAARPLAPFAFSISGALAYVLDTADAAMGSTIVWVNRKGEEQPLSAPSRRYSGDPQISPDGGKAALLIRGENQGNGGSNSDIWVYDLTRGTLIPVTREADISSIVWSADGSRLIYSVRAPGENRGGGSPDNASASPPRNSEVTSRLLSAAADGTGTPIALAQPSGAPFIPFSVARDGTLIGGNRGNIRSPQAGRGQSGELLVLPLTRGSTDATPRTFRNFTFWVFNARLSPDGRWVAYQSQDSGAFEVYVVPYPNPAGERVPVSSGGGTDPRWSANGRELFYRNGDKMMVVDVPPGDNFRPSTPRMLFEKAGSYDVAPDGRFLMIKPPAQSAPEQAPEMHIIVNWFEELRRRVPLENK